VRVLIAILFLAVVALAYGTFHWVATRSGDPRGPDSTARVLEPVEDLAADSDTLAGDSLGMDRFGTLADSAGSGIYGRAYAGPLSPAERPGERTPAPPFTATLVVRDTAGTELTRFFTQEDGSFRQALSPGTYRLIPFAGRLPPGSSPEPHSFPLPPPPRNVTVPQDTWVRVDFRFDTGIR
jgi:hypothetical protein